MGDFESLGQEVSGGVFQVLKKKLSHWGGGPSVWLVWESVTEEANDQDQGRSDSEPDERRAPLPLLPGWNIIP